MTKTRWFEIFELACKLVLIGVLSLVRDEATVFLVASFLVSFVAMMLTSSFAPYMDPLLDRLQTWSLITTYMHA